MKTTRPIFPVPPPPFTTERLLIRPYLPSDREDMFVLRSQPKVMKWTSSKVPDTDMATTREWMASALPPLKGDTFRLAIEERSNPGRVIGVIGIFFSEPPECGYMLRTERWGKGYATEALRAWLEVYWALPRKDVSATSDDTTEYGEETESLLAETAVANTGSRRLLVKCGFTEPRTREKDGEQLMQYTYRPPI
jgi:RimJ/RimL family protein N-acetyltransferase